MKKLESLKIGFVNGYWKLMLMMSTLLMPGRAFAATGSSGGSGEGGGSDAALGKWNDIIGFLTPWISRIGGLVILIGAIEFGLAFKNDDAEAKVKGIRTIVAGCIVFAVGLSSNLFLA